MPLSLREILGFIRTIFEKVHDVLSQLHWDNSCPSPALQPNENVQEKVTDYENSSYFGGPESKAR